MLDLRAGQIPLSKPGAGSWLASNVLFVYSSICICVYMNVCKYIQVETCIGVFDFHIECSALRGLHNVGLGIRVMTV